MAMSLRGMSAASDCADAAVKGRSAVAKMSSEVSFMRVIFISVIEGMKPLLGGFAGAVVAEPFEGVGEVGLGLLGVLGDEVGAASQEVAVAALPEGPLRDVLVGKLRDDLWCLRLREEGLHLRGLLHCGNRDAGGEGIGFGEVFECGGGGGGLFERGGLLEVGELAFGQGEIGRQRLGGLAQLAGFAERDDEIGDARISFELMRIAAEEMNCSPG